MSSFALFGSLWCARTARAEGQAAGAVDCFRGLAARREVLSLRSRALEVLEAAWAARLAFERARGETDAR